MDKCIKLTKLIKLLVDAMDKNVVGMTSNDLIEYIKDHPKVYWTKKDSEL